MNVELINKEEVKNLYSTWSKVASVCYDSTVKNPDAIGKHCMKSGHFSGSRGVYFIFKVTDCPRFAIDQAVRHETGVFNDFNDFKNVQSFRYVNKDSFNYEIPKEIQNNTELLNKYKKHMEDTVSLYDEIQNYVMESGKDKERANEQARYVLPMATHGAFCIGFTIEAFMHYLNMRLCTRTEDVHRQLAMKMRDAVIKTMPELSEYLIPQCERLMYCPEAKGCGRYPSKNEVKELIKSNKVNNNG